MIELIFFVASNVLAANDALPRVKDWVEYCMWRQVIVNAISVELLVSIDSLSDLLVRGGLTTFQAEMIVWKVQHGHYEGVRVGEDGVLWVRTPSHLKFLWTSEELDIALEVHSDFEGLYPMEWTPLLHR